MYSEIEIIQYMKQLSVHDSLSYNILHRKHPLV